MPVRCEISDKVNSFSSAGACWAGVWGSAMSVFMPPLLVMAMNARELDVVVLTRRRHYQMCGGHMSILEMACGHAPPSPARRVSFELSLPAGLPAARDCRCNGAFVDCWNVDLIAHSLRSRPRPGLSWRVWPRGDRSAAAATRPAMIPGRTAPI